jgi:LPS sulfotransferase NodH
MIMPHTSYIICSTPRCGSTLLCETMIRSGIGGRPRELFNPDLEPFDKDKWGVSTYAEYFERAVADGSTPNGVFGAKIMWLYLDAFVAKLRRLYKLDRKTLPQMLSAYSKLPAAANKFVRRLVHRETSRVLSTAFPNLHYVWITRRDKIRQAVSLYRACMTGIWFNLTDEELPPEKIDKDRELAFNFKDIDNLLHDVVIDNDVAWQCYFDACGIEPLKIVYEDFCQDTDTAAIEILEYLGIPLPDDLEFSKRRLLKQSNPLTEEWVQQYREMKASGHGRSVMVEQAVTAQSQKGSQCANC